MASRNLGQSIMRPTRKAWGESGISSVWSKSTYSVGIHVVGEKGYHPMSYRVKVSPETGPLRALALSFGFQASKLVSEKLKLSGELGDFSAL